ncbi:MAG: transcriptional regulator [Nitrososphaerales archaeon]
MLLPSEIESQWIVPAVRSIVAQQLIRHYKFNQTEVAKLLGVTQAAINHYISGSRAKNEVTKKIRRDKQIMSMINEIAESLNHNHQFTPRCMSIYIQLFNYARQSLFICGIHKSLEKEIDDQLCKTCEKFILKAL